MDVPLELSAAGQGTSSGGVACAWLCVVGQPSPRPAFMATQSCGHATRPLHRPGHGRGTWSRKNLNAHPRTGVLKMWKLSDIDPKRNYVIQLCHEATTGQRYFQLRATTCVTTGDDVVFETDVVQNELLRLGNMSRIAQEVKLSNGGAFAVDAHNTWFTSEELDALEDSDDFDSVEWCTATPPMIAPR